MTDDVSAMTKADWVGLLRYSNTIFHKKIAEWRGQHKHDRLDLSGVDLSGNELIVKGADLREVDLNGADFRGTRLVETDLREADLRGASLREVVFVGVDLRGADLRGADLTDARNLFTCSLFGARFEGAIGVSPHIVKAVAELALASLQPPTEYAQPL